MATVMMAMPAPPTTARTGSVTTYHWGRARLVRAVGEVAESVTGPASAYSAWAMPSAVMATRATPPAASRTATPAPSPWQPTSRTAAARALVSTVTATPVALRRPGARSIPNVATSTATRAIVRSSMSASVVASRDSPARRTCRAAEGDATTTNQAQLVSAPVSLTGVIMMMTCIANATCCSGNCQGATSGRFGLCRPSGQ